MVPVNFISFLSHTPVITSILYNLLVDMSALKTASTLNSEPCHKNCPRINKATAKPWMKDWFCLIIWSPINFHWVKLSLAWILTSESPQQKWRPLWLTLVKELASAWEELNHCENIVLTNIFILRRKKICPINFCKNKSEKDRHGAHFKIRRIMLTFSKCEQTAP